MKQTGAQVIDCCPCGSGKPLSDCCLPLIEGKAIAQTAEQLMRSRFTAYYRKNLDYLLFSWHPDTRPAQMGPDELEGIKWLDLTITDRQQGQASDSEGTVSFSARFKIGGKAGRLREKSRFVRLDGYWYYLDGEISH